MNLSRWVDIQLQPLVKNLPSYLKDDNHFLRKIDEINKNHTLPRDTGNMGCYTNIPHKEGLEALKKHFIMRKYREKRQTLYLSSQSYCLIQTNSSSSDNIICKCLAQQ